MPTRQSSAEIHYDWRGKNASGQSVRGEIHANGEAMATATLRRQGIMVTSITKKRAARKQTITSKDIAVLTRQLATMFKSGIPLLQSFDILAQSQSKVSMATLITTIRNDVETGSSLHTAFRQHPLLFNELYCNLVAAGEQAGILEELLERLASYKEKTLALRQKIRTAIMYPLAILMVAFAVMIVIMLWVIPAFKQVFNNFGAELPAPTLFVIAMSDALVQHGWIIFTVLSACIYYFFYTWKRSRAMQSRMDRLMLHLPVLGTLLKKAIWARWSRTLSTMFSAGIPLVDALTSVAAASGNIVYEEATVHIRHAVHTGSSLTVAMDGTRLFPNLATQMVAIGEESGSLDQMLNKVADFYESEVDEATATLSSLMEPFIIVVLGILIGGLVVALYLPIFKLGAVVS
jgi:type IV pilus assembly protein PilC